MENNMTASKLRKLLSELARGNDLQYLITRDEGNLMTVRFYVEGNTQ